MSILKKYRSRGALGEGYARPRTPSPNRLFSVPSANSELIFILDGPKTAILAFFGTLKWGKKQPSYHHYLFFLQTSLERRLIARRKSLLFSDFVPKMRAFWLKLRAFCPNFGRNCALLGTFSQKNMPGKFTGACPFFPVWRLTPCTINC